VRFAHPVIHRLIGSFVRSTAHFKISSAISPPSLPPSRTHARTHALTHSDLVCSSDVEEVEEDLSPAGGVVLFRLAPVPVLQRFASFAHKLR
jgi:hypothetical protein